MNGQNRHIIQKITIELTCNNESTGKRLYHDLGDYIQMKVLPELSDYFDRLTPDGSHIRIDGLELDVGSLPSNGWEQVLKQQILERVRQQMEASGQFLQNPPDRDKQKKTLEQSITEAYLYFLEHGHLPWWAAGHTLQEIEAQLLVNAELSKQLNKLFQNDYNALRRFVRQASDDFIRSVWQNLSPPGRDDGTLPVLQSLFRKVMPRETARQWCWEAAFLPTVSLLKKSDLTARFPGLKNEIERLAQKERPQPAPDPVAPSPKTKDLYVQHAGIVLLSPFFPAFFQHLGLMDNQVFIGLEQQETAVLWLHYLCTGSKECPENETALLKLLCGMAPEQSIPMHLKASAKKSKEVELLLRTAIGYWSALKNTSPDGLRAGFLQREGKLADLGGQWQLTVERKTQDVLMDKIPWGFSVIKFPWMKDMLLVEW